MAGPAGGGLSLLARTGPAPPRPPIPAVPLRRTWSVEGRQVAPWPGARFESHTVTTVAGFSGSHVYQLPTVAIGDRLVLVASCLDGIASFTPTTDLSAWTSFLASELNAFHCWRGYTIYIADAAMVTAWSGVTVTFNSVNGGKSTAVVSRVADGASGAIDVAWDHSGPSATGGDAQPDPPQLVPGWSGTSGYDDHNLWLAYCTFGSGGDSVTSQPQDYHDLASGGAGASQTTTAVAVRRTIAGGEDPGAFQLSGVENWQALTFAIRPVQPAAGPVAGTTRAMATVTATVVGTKIAGGSARALATTTQRATGSKTATAGSWRAAVAAVGRITPAKISPGAVQGQVPVVARFTTAKIGVGSARVAVPITQRTTGTKIAQAAAVAAQGIVGLITGTASGAVQGSVRALVAVTARVTGTKVATGTTRASVPVIVRPTGSKIARGSVLAETTTIGRFTGSSVAAVAGAARALVTITARITGAKVASGAVLAEAPVTGRATGSRAALGAVRGVAAVVARPTGAKSATGAVRAVAAPYVAPAGRKIASGATRAVQAIVGLITRGSAAPPLDVAHRATATSRHRAIATLDLPAGAARHQALAVELHTAEANTTHRAIVRRIP